MGRVEVRDGSDARRGKEGVRGARGIVRQEERVAGQDGEPRVLACHGEIALGY